MDTLISLLTNTTIIESATTIIAYYVGFNIHEKTTNEKYTPSYITPIKCNQLRDVVRAGDRALYFALTALILSRYAPSLIFKYAIPVAFIGLGQYNAYLAMKKIEI